MKPIVQQFLKFTSKLSVASCRYPCSRHKQKETRKNVVQLVWVFWVASVQLVLQIPCWPQASRLSSSKVLITFILQFRKIERLGRLRQRRIGSWRFYLFFFFFRLVPQCQSWHQYRLPLFLLSFSPPVAPQKRVVWWRRAISVHNSVLLIAITNESFRRFRRGKHENNFSFCSQWT